MINVQHSSDLAHGMPFQIKLERLESHCLVVPLIFGEGGVATAAGGASIALAAGRRSAIARLALVFEATGAGWLVFTHDDELNKRGQQRQNKQDQGHKGDKPISPQSFAE